MLLPLLRPLFGLLGALPGLVAAQAMVTILDGEARVVHGKGSWAAVEGLKLPAAALISTDANAKLLRLEWPDGSALDLGPGSQAMVLAEKLSERAAKAPGVYLLRGVAKISARSNTSAPVLVGPGIELPPFTGVAVLQTSPERSAVFAEAGSVTLHDRSAKAPLTLPAGQYWSRRTGEAAAAQPRPPGDWLAQLPRAYRDTLPLRREAMLARNVTPRALPLPAYAELRDWLYTETPVRRLLVTHFTAWSRDPGLRSALITNINDHREWGALVLPPKPDPPRISAPYPASTPRLTP